MKLNDKTLTGITAVCLAVGVGAAGFFLRQDEAAQAPSVSAPLALANVAPLAASIVPLFPNANPPKLVRAMVPMPVPSSDYENKVPKNLKVFASLVPQDPIPQDTGLTEVEIQFSAPTMAALAGFDVAPLRPRELSNVQVMASLPPTLTLGSKRDILPDVQLKLPRDLCRINLRATPKPAARVSLRIVARCHPNSTVTIEHAGLKFRELLDENGSLSLVVPAFSEFSQFNITLRDGLSASTGAYIAGLSSVSRAAISWQGPADIRLVADTPGSNKPRSYPQALLDGGGYLTVLGNSDVKNPMRAQIYTYPVNNAARTISFQVKIANSGTVCEPLEIQTTRQTPFRAVSSVTSQINLDDCANASGSLVLNNLVKDMRIARNIFQ